MVNSWGQDLKYPETKTVEQIDDYFGVKVPDPYRWLEDDVRVSKDVEAWVEAQNKVTFGYLEKLPFRTEIEKRLTKLWDYEKYGPAIARRHSLLLFEKQRAAKSKRDLSAGLTGWRNSCVYRPEPMDQGRHNRARPNVLQ